MRVINIIVHDSETGIISIDSFAVVEEQLSQDVVDEAEELYRTKAGELEFGDDGGDAEDDYFAEFAEKVDDSLDDGYITIKGITLSFVWSYIENL
jgi:hypothetical protein